MSQIFTLNKNPFAPFYLNELGTQSKGSLFSFWKDKYYGDIFIYGIFHDKYLDVFRQDIKLVPFLYIGESINFWVRGYQHRNMLIKGDHHNRNMNRIASDIGVSSLMMVLLEKVDTTGMEYPHTMQFVYEREKAYQDRLLYSNKLSPQL